MNDELDTINKILQTKRLRPIKDDFYWKKHLVPTKPANDLNINNMSLFRMTSEYATVMEELKDSTRNTDG